MRHITETLPWLPVLADIEPPALSKTVVDKLIDMMGGLLIGARVSLL